MSKDKQLLFTKEQQMVELWSEETGKALASELAMTLDERHWQIIHLLRGFYSEHQIAPNNRVLAKITREIKPDEDCSHYLRALFGPVNPAAQAAYIAGLPAKPCLQDKGLQDKSLQDKSLQDKGL